MSRFQDMIFAFSGDLKAILAKSGWTPGRQVDAGPWIASLRSEGYVVSPAAIDVLCSFGGLRVVPRSGPGCAYAADTVVFDPTKSATFGISEVREYEDDFVISLTPIGVVGKDEILCVDDKGRWFGVSSYLLWYGADMNHSFDRLLLAQERPLLDNEGAFPLRRRPMTPAELVEYDREMERERNRRWKAP